MDIKTSIGTPTANSYVSVASADEFLEFQENADAWNKAISNASTATLGAERKKDVLIQATREIDRNLRFHKQKFNIGIIGEPTFQNLEFPRDSNLDFSNNLFIPDEVKFATYSQALWILQRGGIQTNPETGVEFIRRTVGKKAKEFLNPWINKQVKAVEKYPWAGSRF